MTIQEIRQEVMNLYPNPTWAARVHRMPDNQVYAIWCKKREERTYLKENGYISKDKEEEDWPFYHQINIWEWLNTKEENHV